MLRISSVAFLAHLILMTSINPVQGEDSPPVPPPAQQLNENFQQPPLSFPPTPPPGSVDHDEFINGVPVIKPKKGLNTKGVNPTKGQVPTDPQPAGQVEVRQKHQQIKAEKRNIDAKSAAPSKDIAVRKVTPLPPTQKAIKNPVLQEQK